MIIRFDDVSKKFSSTITALRDVNLEVKGGEFVFVVGPSGAGKSTLLRLLAREYPVSSGKISVDDQDISKLKGTDMLEYRRKIGYVFQDFKLLDDRTVFENVALSLEVRGFMEDDVKREVERVLKLFEIWERRNLFPAQLSGGEAQRTAIARAIISKPDLLIADEPTGDLDPQTAWGVIQLLNEINSWGTTVMMATHNVEIVNSLKRRVIYVKNGTIAKDKSEGKYELH
ncbi:cell division ATP-binding protein FtsE [Candidatus Daviesbacteria bacterium RIFCSPHIGHO2_01_FULL_44_29]|uniref:Cell division ATP-binding protein FtsE n=1 Tax=Candidatus Daviesbacteria bacterium RIFCSPHIGHO2_02_FULL_43_12 TaxID=1797776 RepID=A0A1F5KKD1_9BACT|nr:MAG: cell division ATP-binding protein FtsE [Candidatus Daviesbacteria bacterium RIFCSPHIGHO2_01_FULL_44_29]OGE40870.1 MAG: cell division ATP-binding protein FtsE [Candidatus Daviesbacteria bacterium RIFCSPHIGHO2_12_FULL_47_45]OGE41383.1 MAG: cell division ATP-binding protein FtsE [Candidatus Daviesbacteria bacterium RIFCSPHIGHO2_02_FULL_43_12]OGE69584.1 MAG: cell division ATP-binding protein FtsE [Candidatus Daviesbacteria bacterium RIFCSPLOWO2_01_FULL_43_15]